MWVGQLCLGLAPGAGGSRSRSISAGASNSSGAPSSASSSPPPPPPTPAQQPRPAAARGTAPAPSQQQAAPWSLSNYYTKKLARQTDSLGNILSSADTIAAAPGWTPDAQLRLAADALSAELQQDAAELLEQASERWFDLGACWGGSSQRRRRLATLAHARQLQL